MGDFNAESLLEDDNFKVLASPHTELAEFSALVVAHASGYTQQKRVMEGMKLLISQLEQIEQKLVVAKAVGKSKGKLEDNEQQLYHLYSMNNLKEKLQALSKSTDAAMEEGALSAEERPAALEQLNARLEKAKAEGKAKLQEKLERIVAGLSSSAPARVPVADVKEIQTMRKKVELLEQWSKLPRSALTEEQRAEVRERISIERELTKLEAKNQMWFETAQEYKPRLKDALVLLAQREEEEARLEAIRLEEEKRLAAQRKEEQKWREIQEKLDHKRELAKLAPQKEAPAPKKKEKKKVVKLDNKVLFGQAENGTNDENHNIEEYEDEEGDAASQQSHGGSPADPTSPDELASPAADDLDHHQPVDVPHKTVEAKVEPKAVSKAEPKVSAWAAGQAAPDNGPQEEEEVAEDSSELPALGPSLADAAKRPQSKKAAAPAPAAKKAGKKKFTKMSLDAVGFQYSDAGQPAVARPPPGTEKSAWGQPV